MSHALMLENILYIELNMNIAEEIYFAFIIIIIYHRLSIERLKVNVNLTRKLIIQSSGWAFNFFNRLTSIYINSSTLESLKVIIYEFQS